MRRAGTVARSIFNPKKAIDDSGGLKMQNPSKYLALGLLPIAVGSTTVAHAANSQIERGKYLVDVIGCSDCHTPGSMEGKPDMSRFLAGGNVAFNIPGLGSFIPGNLTPDKLTGLGGIANLFVEGPWRRRRG